jgi:hypothetical protein
MSYLTKFLFLLGLFLVVADAVTAQQGKRAFIGRSNGRSRESHLPISR